MSEEYDNSDISYSPFWPLLILLAGIVLWLGYQVFMVNQQRSLLNRQYQHAGSAIEAAKNWQGRYGAIMKDLNDTSAKDPTAASIFKDAVQAGVQSGLIHVQPGTNTTTTPAAPAPSSTPSSSSTK